jgi:hypothetical protein
VARQQADRHHQALHATGKMMRIIHHPLLLSGVGIRSSASIVAASQASFLLIFYGGNLCDSSLPMRCNGFNAAIGLENHTDLTPRTSRIRFAAMHQILTFK